MTTAIPGSVCALAFVFAALVIRHVRVFDGESVINNTSVLITNGKVQPSVQA